MAGKATGPGGDDDPPAFYNIHVFCCSNRREPGDARGSCAAKGSEALCAYMKERARRLGVARLRINLSGCLDRCELGPVMVIYPEGIWYGYDSEADIDEILERHLRDGARVARLMLRPGDVVPPARTA